MLVARMSLFRIFLLLFFFCIFLELMLRCLVGFFLFLQSSVASFISFFCQLPVGCTSFHVCVWCVECDFGGMKLYACVIVCRSPHCQSRCNIQTLVHCARARSRTHALEIGTNDSFFLMKRKTPLSLVTFEVLLIRMRMFISFLITVSVCVVCMRTSH